MVTADTCYGYNGQWWRGTYCGSQYNTACGCQQCTPCEGSMTTIDGVNWNQKCTVNPNDPRSNPPEWPQFVYDTAFTQTDPSNDQEWVVKIEVAAEDEADNGLMEMASWAMGVAGAFAGSPLAAMIPFAVEKTLEYLKFGEEDDEDRIIELDLATTVDRILEITSSNDDQRILVEKIRSAKDSMSSASDELAVLANDRSITSSLETIVIREHDLKDRFVDLFNDDAFISSRPEAAWYLYEPMFALMDTRFQFVVLEYGLKWAQASGARDISDAAGTYPAEIDQAVRETECENLAEYMDGPLINGNRDRSNTGSLAYQWDRFTEYFELAWNERLAAIPRETTFTQTVRKTAEKWDFGNNSCGRSFTSANRANHESWNQQGCKWAELDRSITTDYSWIDSWRWGSTQNENAAEFTSSWTATSDYEYCYHSWGSQYNAALCCNRCSTHVNRAEGPIRNGNSCQINYSGQRSHTANAHGMTNYMQQALGKKREIYNTFHAAYTAMRRTLQRTITTCKAFNRQYAIDQLQNVQSIPNGPIQRSVLEQDPLCMPIQPWLETKQCPSGYSPYAPEGFAWSLFNNMNMNGLLGEVEDRCPFRYNTLSEAQSACTRYAECFGVTRDNGLCGGKRYELRGRGSGGSMSAWTGMTTWFKSSPAVLMRRESCTNAIGSIQFWDSTNLAECSKKCAERAGCSHFTVFEGVACRLFSDCPEEGRYVTSTQPAVTYELHSTVWCKSDEPVYERWNGDDAFSHGFARDPVRPTASSGSQCGDDFGGENNFCLERYLGFPFNRNGDGKKSFSVTKVDFHGAFSEDGAYDIEVWRAAGPTNNEAYRGSNNMLPVAEGRFRFVDVITDGATEMGPIRVRVDSHDEFYVYEDEQGNDTGVLRQTDTLPSGFLPGDLVCASVRSNPATRQAKTRNGLSERRRVPESTAAAPGFTPLGA